MGPEPKAETPLRKAVREIKKATQCNCDLDRWEPERDTGHSWVCRIHKLAKRRVRAEEGGWI